MYALFGFDYDVVSNLESERSLFKPFPNKSRLDKTDLLFVYDNITNYHQDRLVLEPSTWDMLIEYEKIDFLTINGDHGSDRPGYFTIKFDSITAPSLDILGYLHIPFAKPINKFYISNPTQEKLYVDIVYLKKSSQTDKVNTNLYQKTDTMLYWHIKHNFGIEPTYTFLDNTGTPIEPSYTVELYNKNEIVFHFSEPYQGYVFFNDYMILDVDDYASTWEATHNLDKYPSILAFDTLGARLTNFTKVYDDLNKVTLHFTKQQAGKLIVY